jgi:hypothetical protein
MRQRTSARVTELFNLDLRSRRRDRAFRIGPELFLHERAFEDCLERIGLIQRKFTSALLIGCPDPAWVERLHVHADAVDVIEPGGLFARAANAEAVVEDRWAGSMGHDLCLAVGTLDTVNDLHAVLHAIRSSLVGDALLIGAIAGGDTLPQLRAAMRAADKAQGGAAAHVHPRIEAAGLAPLLSGAGFAMPVVDVDRVPVSYPSLGRLVADLRAMAATNILQARPKSAISKAALAAATSAFQEGGSNGRTTEMFEILHFAAWTPATSDHG